MLYLHAGWHDKEENKIGKLTTLLATDVDELKNLTGNLYITVL